MKQNFMMNGRALITLFPNTATGIFLPMKHFTRHIFPFLALLSFLFGSVLVEFAHHDEHSILLQSDPVLESHDCGAREIHIAWEDARHCVACSQSTQRLSTEARSFSAPDATVSVLSVLLKYAEQTLETDILYSGKRGPPFA